MTLATQRALLEDMYRTHVAPGTPYALVDFPDHPNVGDSAIWLGELACLQEVTGYKPLYVSAWHDFDAGAFRAACPAGPLFLHGGGNLGDIWPHHQRFRETVLEQVRDRPVVQLPQSIHFRAPANAARFEALAAEHPDFSLYVRDSVSLAFARARGIERVRLLPDSAIALGKQSRAVASEPLLMLLRRDDEAAGDHAARGVDWLEDDLGVREGTSPQAREAQARTRVARGLRLLSRGERGITDRLHGHILNTLLGIPHVVLDNDYGKIAAYRTAWPLPEPAVATATTLDEAMAHVERL
jgi:pyruvyl transferase EpsO